MLQIPKKITSFRKQKAEFWPYSSFSKHTKLNFEGSWKNKKKGKRKMRWRKFKLLITHTWGIFDMGCCVLMRKYFEAFLCHNTCVYLNTAHVFMNKVYAGKEFLFRRNFLKNEAKTITWRIKKKEGTASSHVSPCRSPKKYLLSSSFSPWWLGGVMRWKSFLCIHLNEPHETTYQQGTLDFTEGETIMHVHTKHFKFLLDWVKTKGMSRLFLFAYLSQMPVSLYFFSNILVSNPIWCIYLFIYLFI